MLHCRIQSFFCLPLKQKPKDYQTSSIKDTHRANQYSHYGRTVWSFLKKLEIELPHNPAIPLLGTHTEKTRTQRDTCNPVFIATLFTIARTWKQPRCPSADEWIRKLWYIYTMEYYSAIIKNTFESVLMRWMKLEPIIQSEVSQKEIYQQSILILYNIILYNMCTLIHMYMEFRKMVNDNPICKTARDTDVKNRLLDSGEGEGGMT